MGFQNAGSMGTDGEPVNEATMPIEAEQKYRVTDLGEMRARLAAAGAKPLRRVRERNTLFDTPDRALLRRDCGLRVREERNLDTDEFTAILTYKGPRADVGGVKAREEIEVGVSDAAAITAIIRGLDMFPTISYQKTRESFSLAGAQVELDDADALGLFVEIEADPDRIPAIAASLGLTAEQVEPRTYPQMASDLC